MEDKKVNLYLINYGKYIPGDKKIILKNALVKSTEDKEENLSVLTLINPITVLICSIFLSSLGVDRFIVGDIGLGVCKLLFGWLTLGIWPFIDIFFSYKRAKEKNLQSILEALS